MKEEKFLHLTLKKKWFDMIASGEKKEEYRIMKPYWMRRLIIDNSPKESPEENKDLYENLIFDRNKYSWEVILKSYYLELRSFDYIIFRNGYNKNAPRLKAECKGIEICTGLEMWGAETSREYFVIKIGKIK